jgi:Domain of unknown function (DUF5666)
MKSAFRVLPLAVACAVMLSACGGGGGGVAVATKAVSGTISGLGSVVLNGVRYETIGASVVDSDGGTTIRTPLGLGMTVAIDPSVSSATAAGAIHVQSGIKGSTSAIDATAKTLNVAGLPVTTDTSTFIVTAAGAAGSFADLQSSSSLWVEVYGIPQSDGTFKATRIEIKTQPSTTDTVQLVGVVSTLNTANNTFTLGSGSNTVTVTYSSASAPTGLVVGSVVSVHTSATASAATYTATSLYLRSANATTFAQYTTQYAGTSGVSNEVNELYGMVSNLTQLTQSTSTSPACSLQVQGVPTTLVSPTLCAAIQNGDYVEVKGVLSNGALTAHRLEFKTSGGDRTLANSNTYSDDVNDTNSDGLKYSRRLNSTTNSSSSSSGSSDSGYSYEIYGTLACTSATSSSCALTSNGTSYTADLSTAIWEHGTVTSGLVEVKGYMTTSSVFKVVKAESKQ